MIDPRRSRGTCTAEFVEVFVIAQSLHAMFILTFEQIIH